MQGLPFFYCSFLQPEMIVLDPSAVTQVLREPRDVQKEKQAAAEAVSGERRGMTM